METLAHMFHDERQHPSNAAASMTTKGTLSKATNGGRDGKVHEVRQGVALITLDVSAQDAESTTV